MHDELVTDAAVERLQELGEQRRGGVEVEPFCLSVGLDLPHQPYVAHRDDYDRYVGRVSPPTARQQYGDSLHPYIAWWREATGIVEVSDAEIDRARTAYWALVDRLDTMIGRILDALREAGLADSTVIVYTSDHGEQAGEHDLWWKQTFYEGSVKVPAIISWPGVIPAGQRVERVVSALDITETILDATGAPSLPYSRGRTLLNVLTRPGDVVPWQDEAFSEFCTDAGWITRMIRRGPWKLNYYHQHQPQLFNLARDPHELEDLAADPTHAQVRLELEERILQEWDPDDVMRGMDDKRRQNAILSEWARQTKPPEPHRWILRPEMDYLDDRQNA